MGCNRQPKRRAAGWHPHQGSTPRGEKRSSMGAGVWLGQHFGPPPLGASSTKPHGSYIAAASAAYSFVPASSSVGFNLRTGVHQDGS